MIKIVSFRIQDYLLTCGELNTSQQPRWEMCGPWVSTCKRQDILTSFSHVKIFCIAFFKDGLISESFSLWPNDYLEFSLQVHD